MNIKAKKQNHFLNLLEDSTLAAAYFHNQDMSEFNNQRLIELQNNYKKAEAKYNRKSSILSITLFLGLEARTLALKVGQEHRKMMSSMNELDVFESKLAYLLVSGIISFEKCEKLGFNRDYVKKLLEHYKKQAENSYVEYYYNEKTGRTSVQTENGSTLILPYTPSEIRRAIR